MNKRTVPISVIIPCYQCKATIRRAVESVATQTVLPAQVILVDDFSDDGTLAELYRLRDSYESNWIQVISSERNYGAAEARNKGWNVAFERYIAFLDADDRWHPQKIEVQYTWMKNHPDVAITGHYIDEQKPDRATSLCVAPDSIDAVDVSSVKLLMSNRLATSTVMLKRDIPFRFSKGKRRSEDYLLWLEICLSGYSVAVINCNLANSYKARFGESGLSGNLWAMQRDELATYREIYTKEHIGRVSLGFYSIYSILKFVRRLFVKCVRTAIARIHIRSTPELPK